MVHEWELEKARKWTTTELKDWIWLASNGLLIPGYISVEALRKVLVERGEDGKGYHNS